MLSKLIAKKKWIIVLGIILFCVVLNYFFREVHSIPSHATSCVKCHGDVMGFSLGHQNVSCASCHLGNTSDFTKNAHEGMISIPGNLDNVSKTCAQSGCHVGIDHRVKTSLMNTMSGVVAVDKFIFGESWDLDQIHHIDSLKFSAADTHLRQLCASCHLGNNKMETGAISELTRGGGCNACHLNYSADALKNHQEYLNSEFTNLPKVHPSLSLNISDDHCFGCHSRSARISTNYEGWHEISISSDTFSKTRILKDGRQFGYVQADIHHDLGLNCIDCHSANDVMGDGNIYAHESEAVKIQCKDCHQKDNPKTVLFDDLDAESQKIIQLRNLPKDVKYVVGENDNPLINVYENTEGNLVFIGKISKKNYKLSPPNAACLQKSHEKIACETCHTAWAPQCVSCHTSFDTTQLRYDHLTHLKHQGKWIEKGDMYRAEYPTLGVMKDDEIEKIKTFIQGMTMTLDQSAFPNKNDVKHIRRFAPTFAHTISKKGQSCSNCHRNPIALGYGKGTLKFDKHLRKWKFTPSMGINVDDNLPKDAWIGFMNKNIGNTTRKNGRSLNQEEQIKMLKAGTCLTCHKDDSEVSALMLKDFQSALLQISPDCIQMSN